MIGELLLISCARDPGLARLAFLGALAFGLVAVMALIIWVIEREEGKVNKTDRCEVDWEAWGRAEDSLTSALGLLKQVRSAVPPYFHQRFEACVSSAMHDLGMSEPPKGS